MQVTEKISNLCNNTYHRIATITTCVTWVFEAKMPILLFYYSILLCISSSMGQRGDWPRLTHFEADLLIYFSCVFSSMKLVSDKGKDWSSWENLGSHPARECRVGKCLRNRQIQITQIQKTQIIIQIHKGKWVLMRKYWLPSSQSAHLENFDNVQPAQSERWNAF